jgi:hypothetical protein
LIAKVGKETLNKDASFFALFVDLRHTEYVVESQRMNRSWTMKLINRSKANAKQIGIAHKTLPPEAPFHPGTLSNYFIEEKACILMVLSPLTPPSMHHPNEQEQYLCVARCFPVCTFHPVFLRQNLM